MTKAYSVAGTDNMDLELLESFKEANILTLNTADARGFIERLRLNDNDLFSSVMEDVREKFQAGFCEEEVSDIVVLSSHSPRSRASETINYFDKLMIDAVEKFIKKKLYDYDQL